MSALAKKSPPDGILASEAIKPVKEPRISKRMRKVLTLLATRGMTQRDAAKQGGMSETYLSAALRKPEIQAFIASETRRNMQITTIRASARWRELIDADSEHVAAKVAERHLTSEGILKGDSSQVSVNVGVSVGYVIDLTGNGRVIDGTG